MSDNAPKAPGLATRMVHSEYAAPAGFAGLTTPVHHVSTVVFPTVAEMRTRVGPHAYTYGLHATPTTLELQAQIAALEGGHKSVLTPSGLASISLVDLAMLKNGDHVLIPDNVYRPNREVAHRLLEGLGIGVDYYDPMAAAGIAALIRDNTKLLWIEAPGSLTMDVPDVPALVAAARVRGVVTAIDNTWSAGVYFRAFEHDIDISIQAVTKYIGGHSDLLMGSVTTRNEELFQHIAATRRLLGYSVGPDDVFLALRGLSTMLARLKAHGDAALEVARWLTGRPEVTRLLHPAFPSCPGHEHWKRDFTGSSGLFSIVIDAKYSQAAVDAMIEGLRWFRIGYSWAGPASLAVPYQRETLFNARQRAEPGHLVRLNIGLEDPADLIADLEAGFARLQSGK
ncbi:MAG: cystathionine beta-lyase [Betaproteobacteria bacterium]